MRPRVWMTMQMRMRLPSSQVVKAMKTDQGPSLKASCEEVKEQMWTPSSRQRRATCQ